MPPATVFLMYHELELPGRPFCQSDPGYVRYIISAVEFARQMDEIAALGMRGVSVSEALNFSGPQVCLTFDDGCETDLISAAPVLKARGFAATFYAVSGFIGRQGYLSPTQLRELRSLGFEIGCHSMTHPYLPDLDQAGLDREICDAKSALEQLLGISVDHFSCPGGRFDTRVIDTARKAGFDTVATSIPRANSNSSDRLSLGRVAITREITAQQFRTICSGESLWKLEFGVGLRDRAKKLLGNSTYDRVRALLLKK